MQRSSFLTFLILGFLTLYTASIYRAINREVPVRYLGFDQLVVESESCPTIVRDAGAFKSIKRVVTWPLAGGEPDYKADCKSNWLKPQGDVIELEYTSRVFSPESDLRIELEQEGNPDTQIRKLAGGQTAGEWRLLRFYLPETQSRFRVNIIDAAGSYSWLALRTRVGFFERLPYSSAAEYLLGHTALLLAFLFVSAFLLVGLLFMFIRCGFHQSWGYIFLLFFFLALAWMFSGDASYFSDDWHLLSNLSEHGLSSLWTPYSGHFMPIVYFLFYLQYSLFADYSSFLIVSLFIHAVNSMLVARLVYAILSIGEGEGSEQAQLKQVALICGFLYLSSGLHGESTQWVSTQGSLLSLFLMLSAILSALHYIDREQMAYLVLSSICALAAPLCFASGILAAPWVILFLLYLIFFSSRITLNRPRICKTFVAHLMILLLSVSFYLFSAKDQVAAAFRVEWLTEIALYSFVGSCLATFFRGSGLASLYEVFSQSDVGSHPIYISSFSLLISLSLLLIYYVLSHFLDKDRKALRFREDFGLWLLGQLLMFLPYVLIALGRLRLGNYFGVTQALVQRYHTLSLLGFVIAILPLVRVSVSLLLHSKRSRYRLRIAFIMFVLVFQQSAQLELAREHSFIREDGYRTRIYLDQLQDWRNRIELSADFASSVELHDRRRDEFEGLYPLQYGRGWHVDSPKAITSILEPEQMLSVSKRD
jgi:hypothetical protein